MLAAAFGLLAAGGARGADREVELVVDGQSRALIVLPSGAGPRSVEAVAARCLSDHLFLISGARLEIVRESELGAASIENQRLSFPAGKAAGGIDSFVLVGPSDAAASLGLTSEGLGPGGILVRTRGNALALLGPASSSDDGGTRYAVIEFLEALGVRYLWPGETGRVLPRMSTLSAGPMDLHFTPPIGQRRIRFMGMRERAASGLENLQLSDAQWRAAASEAAAMRFGQSWGVWQRLGGQIGIGGGHAGAGLSGGWAEHGARHPEWFALQADGTRDQAAAGNRSRLCKSNPELIEFVAADILRRLEDDVRPPSAKSVGGAAETATPPPPCISLSPNDGGYSSHCLCENCERLDPPQAPKIRLLVFDKVGQSRRQEIEHAALTDRMVWYWNQIAERVGRKRPDVLFLVDAYGYWSTPPVREQLHPNLVVRYVPAEIDGWEGWKRAEAKRIYWRPNILLTGRREGTLQVMVQRLADTMSFFADRGMLATDFDSVIDYWSLHGLNYYATARLNWNPHLTADEILDSYCRPGFGAGAEHVKRYFERVQELSAAAPMPEYDPSTLRQLRDLLDQADRAAEGDESVRDRIAFLRMGLNFTELQATLDALSSRAAAKSDPPPDRRQTEWLLDLNYLMLRDMTRSNPLVLNAPYLMQASGDFARRSPIGGRGYRPSPQRLKDFDSGNFALTGRENSLAEMGAALGLAPPPQSE